MKVVIAGGSGALGRALCRSLVAHGHDVVVLTRRVRDSPYRQVVWDGRTVGPWAAELEGAAVVNLAGELVDRRPTATNIALLTRSRVEPTRALVEASHRVDAPPVVWLQASTLALFGDAGDATITEDTPVPTDGPPQMTGVARAWEAATSGARADRMVVLRTSIVLDRDTPALIRLAGLARWGIGGRVGSGRQWVSWLHVDDWLRVVHWSLGDQTTDLDLPVAPPPSGVLVVTAPHPVRNAELMATLRAVLHRPAAPPTPRWAVQIGAVVLRTDPTLGLTGRRAVSTRLADAGFTFRHPDLREALEDLLDRH